MNSLSRNIFLGASIVVLAGCASAPKAPDSDDRSGLSEFIRADKQAGLDITIENGDELGEMCARYLLNRDRKSGSSTKVVGVFSAYMKARGLRRKVDAGVDIEYRKNCGPMMSESRSVIRKRILKRALPF